jgi:predicted ATPase
MIEKIYVDGFRSLIEFDIELSDGLNVLVGSNGTGKSNFITFLDFLGKILETDLNSAIAVAKGAGSVFSKEKFEKENRAELNFRIIGKFSNSGGSEDPFGVPDESFPKSFSYDYECTVEYIKTIPAVYISREILKIGIPGQAAIHVDRSTSRSGGQFVSKTEVTPTGHPILKDLHRWYSDSKRKSDTQFLTRYTRPEASILSVARSMTPLFGAIVYDMSRFRSINIDPSAARKPTPVGTKTEIQPSGEGLAGALYRLERGNYYAFDSYNMFRRRSDHAKQAHIYRNIMSWCREVNGDIQSVRVDLDFQEAYFRPVLIFRINNKPDEFSFNRISDGTVKWLALVTVLYSSEHLSVIEEPENFLHPFMQESFINLCRQIISNENDRNIIVSTHSPTLLDCCDPSELRIFESEHGKSRASKVANRAELMKKVESSRFGLGYYYRTGGVYGEDRGAG